MNSIFHRKKDSPEYYLGVIINELEQQFKNYKCEKTLISSCSSFDDYGETKRLSKGNIIDYQQISMYELGNFNYELILVYLTNKQKIPVSYYLFINVEKSLANHTSLLSLRFDDLCEVEKKYKHYQKIFDKKDVLVLLEEIKKDMFQNEWNLY